MSGDRSGTARGQVFAPVPERVGTGAGTGFRNLCCVRPGQVRGQVGTGFVVSGDTSVPLLGTGVPNPPDTTRPEPTR